MGEKEKELSATFDTDTSKMKLGQSDIQNTIGNGGSKLIGKDQIPVSLDKREKELAKTRKISENGD